MNATQPKKEKTFKELYEEFKQKFTIDQVSTSVELSMIHEYLQQRCSMASGNYVHVPGQKLKGLIIKHMGLVYNEKKSPALEMQEI